MDDSAGVYDWTVGYTYTLFPITFGLGTTFYFSVDYIAALMTLMV